LSAHFNYYITGLGFIRVVGEEMNLQNRRNCLMAVDPFKGKGGSFPGGCKETWSKLSAIFLIVALVFPFLRFTPVSAQSTLSFIRRVRSMDADEIGLVHPSGLLYSNRGNAFQMIGALGTASGGTDFVKLTSLAKRAGSQRLPISLQNPINVVFDNNSNRLLFLQGLASVLVAVPADNQGNLNTAKFSRFTSKAFSLQDPQGLTVDEKSRSLFILDAGSSRIVRVTPTADGNFNNASVSEIDLRSPGFSDIRGIAFNPTSGNLFVIDPVKEQLHEMTQSGELVATRDLAPLNLRNPQGMTFAPSGDQTDDPAQMSLYVADSGSIDGQGETAATQSMGQVVELSLTPLVEAASISFTASLVRTTNMAAASPPSPDPSGIAYLPDRNTLMVVDGEVEETTKGITHFQGANLWELTLSGSVVNTANISKVSPTVAPMTNEPTDVAWDSTNNHYYVSDDSTQRVFDLDVGGDGLIGTADDTWTYFGTDGVGSGDPEGITYNPSNNHIFVADGSNAEVYEFTTTGTLINHFDVQRYGVIDPESIEFNLETGTLLTMSSNRSTPVIVETTTSGALVETIDISVIQARAAAGLAYAPASDGSGEKRFYIVDRGVDNNTDPEIVDGKMYEVTAPPAGAVPVKATIGGSEQDTYLLSAHESKRVNFPNLNNGPVDIASTNSALLMASQRVLYDAKSFSEMMGLPKERLSKEYWFPYYNNIAMDSQLRVSNLGDVPTTITVRLAGQQIDQYSLGAGSAVRRNYPNRNGGPLQVTSSAANFLATIRVLYGGNSYSELMGFPVDQLTKEYLFPYYNNVAMDSQLRVSNLGDVPTTITVSLAGQQIDQYILGAGGAVRRNYPNRNGGLLRVTSSATNILTTIRVLYGGNDYSELMGYPSNQIAKEYWYPVYDNSTVNSQLRVSNAGSGSTTVKVYVGGTQIDSYTLGVGAASRKNYPQNAGPLHVVSDPEPVLTTIRTLYATSGYASYYEMMGLPGTQLSSQYFFPWYNNAAMSSELRFGVP
jgi:uncharacterized protein YjiK